LMTRLYSIFFVMSRDLDIIYQIL